MSPIVGISARGDGRTEDGRHVALAAPGDHVEEDGTVLPGPHHATPPCRHFPTCGGCQLQHVDDAAYADYLRERIVGALAAQRIEAPELRPVHLSPPRTRRRASLRVERIGKRVVLGFNAEATHRIVDLAECHVLHPDLFALVAPLRGLLGPMLKRGRAAGIALTLADEGVDVLLSGVAAEGLEAAHAIIAFAEQHGLARLAIDDGIGPQAWWEPRPVTVALGGVSVPLPPGAFLQATADGEGALRAAVAEAVGGAATVVDLFAGLGTFALPLSTRGKVLAVEGAREPLLALKGAAARGGRLLATEHRDLFRRPLSTDELDRFDAVVLDPPRAGAKEQAQALAATKRVMRIAYVSCSPSTFARDARALIEGGWRLASVQPVGQFRWSTHVELAAAFER